MKSLQSAWPDNDPLAGVDAAAVHSARQKTESLLRGYGDRLCCLQQYLINAEKQYTQYGSPGELWKETLGGVPFSCFPANVGCAIEAANIGRPAITLELGGQRESFATAHNAVDYLGNYMVCNLGFTDPVGLMATPEGLAEMTEALFKMPHLNLSVLSTAITQEWAATLKKLEEKSPPPNKIPAEFRTKAITKKLAAKLMGRPNEDSGVKWLNQCIEDGSIICEKLSRQGFVFDIRDFPEHVHPQLSPTPANSR